MCNSIKTNDLNDDIIINILSKYKAIPWSKISKEIKDYIENRFSDSVSFEESWFRIKHKILIKPICPICGKTINGTRRGFNKTCSRECGSQLSFNTRKEELLEKYNVENVFQLKEIQEKSKQTFREKYNCEYSFQSAEIREKFKQTCLEKYGVDNPSKNKEIHEKIEKSTFNHFGVTCGCLTISNEERKRTIEKSFKTVKFKYNVENVFCLDEIKEKIKQTCLEKYGVDNPAKSKIVQEKYKRTCLKKYGVDNYFKTDIFKKQFQENLLIKQQKEYISKKKNGTFNSSKEENDSFELLKIKYPDIIHQYRDERYPFNCDFYIPSLDLFIECQYSWTHGGHPYNQENDKEKLELWESKNTQYYKNAINTWTIRDVKKREIAKQNNLNYLEFFNKNDLIIWINSSINKK